MKLKLFSLLSAIAFIAFILSSCGGNAGLKNVYNVTKCNYEYQSTTDLTLSGMNLSNGVSPLQTTKILALIAKPSSSIPLDLTINLDVSNPNSTVANLLGMSYVFSIDGVQFTTGSAKQGFNIQPGASQLYPLTIGIDLATLLKGESKTAVENIIKNFIGVGSEKSTVKLQIKPTFNIGNLTVSSPVYIPISFSFGGK